MDWFVTIIVAAALGAAGGYLYRKQAGEKKIGRTEEYARNLLEDAQRKADEKKKETILEAKEEVLRLKTELDRECRERRAEVQRSERRILQREESLDKKQDALETREEALGKKQNELQKMQEDIENDKQRQVAEMERIAGMTQDEACQMLVSRIQKDAYHDAAAMVREIETRAREEGEKKARNIIALAIQKCAADHVAESTVSVINLPNDDMKGRIIGREGRNIRALETATGVDLIIDDTPEAVIVSAFDPVRREIARIAVERLIMDGRIHPARIEEMVEKARKEVDQQIREAGEQAVFETLQNRGTAYERDSFDRVIALAHNKDIQIRWRQYLRRLKMPELVLEEVMHSIDAFLRPVWDAITNESELLHTWHSQSGLWSNSQ